ncbi:MAG: F0F1 ATP synthase subunit B [Patescibacteria group bacterium]
MPESTTQTAVQEVPAQSTGILGTFGLKPSLFIAQLINFAIIVFVLKKWVFTPLLKTMDERKKVIDDGLKRAEDSEFILQRAKKDEQIILNDARTEGQEIVEACKEQGEKEKQNRIIASNQIIARQLADAKSLAQAEAEAEKQSVREHAAKLIIAGVEKVTLGAMNAKTQSALIDDAIAGFEQHAE